MADKKEFTSRELVPVEDNEKEIALTAKEKENETAKAENKEKSSAGAVIAAVVILALILAAVIFLGPKLCSKQQEEYDPTAETTISRSDITAGESGVVLSVRSSAEDYVAGDTLVFTAAIENRSTSYVALCARNSAGQPEDVLKLNVTADGYQVHQSNAVVPTVSTSDCFVLLAPGDSLSKVFVFDSNAVVDGALAKLWTCELQATLSVEIGPSFVKRQTELSGLAYTVFTDTETAGYYGVGVKPGT